MVSDYLDSNKHNQVSFLCKSSRIKRSKRSFCGAKTRKGLPCKAPPVWNKKTDKPRNGRCKLHGGLSTGPITEKGRDSIRESNKRRSRQYQAVINFARLVHDDDKN